MASNFRLALAAWLFAASPAYAKGPDLFDAYEKCVSSVFSDKILPTLKVDAFSTFDTQALSRMADIAFESCRDQEDAVVLKLNGGLALRIFLRDAFRHQFSEVAGAKH